MLMTRIPRRLAMAAILMITLQACAHTVPPPIGEDRDLAQIEKSLNITTQALAAFGKAVISANLTTPKLIPDATANQLARFSLEMNKATKEAIQATRTTAKLSPADRQNINLILDPVLLAIDNTLKSPGLASIQTEQLRLILQTSLTAIQSTVASVQMLLSPGRQL